MAIPKSIDINGCKIKVNLVKNLYRDYMRYGEYSSVDMEINLDESLTEQKKELIFCHEMLEAILDIYLLSLEENEIQSISVALHGVLKTKQIEFG